MNIVTTIAEVYAMPSWLFPVLKLYEVNEAS